MQVEMIQHCLKYFKYIFKTQKVILSSGLSIHVIFFFSYACNNV